MKGIKPFYPEVGFTASIAQSEIHVFANLVKKFKKEKPGQNHRGCLTGTLKEG
jgi:hypothetical protein